MPRKSEAAHRKRDVLIEDALTAGRELGAAAVMFHATVAARVGLGATEEKTIDLLERFGPLTPSELVGRTGLAPATMSAIIDRLEDKGFARRVPHPADGRRVLVEPDPSIHQRMAPMFRDFGAALVELLGRYSDEELVLVTAFMREAAAIQSHAASRLAMPDDAPS